MTIDNEADPNKVKRDGWETPAMVRLDAADAQTWGSGWPGGLFDDWFDDWFNNWGGGGMGMRAS